ncbi:sigma-E processing peptidase SpoIIGA [Paenibacillus sp. 1011MAR3C5]|uniref:sigma-E processing peptidase SpoIIGA n=1 Tax=Paenibacillus sp. 1011MAR3C5 TaxID=1675787 RepID=UPI000E6CBDD7|nr:sigma-E processing peptidase SpoIIGA [Paenibacillus sp. 1011MAR3C5]RJE90762.1 sigma-E processing peptidase SpoIIGA [Paenibacillus sp. 1011MAR3C5]
MTVYVDILFLRELLVDGAVLLTTAWVRHTKPRPWRILGASAFGACYVVLMLYPQLSFLFTLVVKVLFSFVMVWIAFGFSSLQHYIRNIAAFYSVNFVAAGAVLGLYYLFMQGSGAMWKTLTIAGGSIQAEIKLSIFYLAAAFAIGLYVYRAVMTGRRERELVRNHMAEVKVTIGDKTYACTGLIDTGNQLYDPLTRIPVMVMEVSRWEGALPDSWIKSVREGGVDRLIADMDADSSFEWQDRLRLVPFRGVNRGSQFMLALKPDSVEVAREGQVFETSRVLIGFDGGKLAADGAYQAIIHPAMVQT